MNTHTAKKLPEVVENGQPIYEEHSFRISLYYASYFFRSIFTCLIIEKLVVEERADNVFLEGKLEHMAKDTNMECSKDSNESCSFAVFGFIFMIKTETK